MYNEIICGVLGISPARARMVEAFLRLQYGTLDALSKADMVREYGEGGISEAIDTDPAASAKLAASYGLN